MNPKWNIRKGKRINKHYEKWLKKHEKWNKCCVCFDKGVGHHVGNRRNDSYSLVYLCDFKPNSHHTGSRTSYHVLGQKKFEEIHNISLYEIIYEQLSEYIEEMDDTTRV